MMFPKFVIAGVVCEEKLSPSNKMLPRFASQIASDSQNPTPGLLV